MLFFMVGTSSGTFGFFIPSVEANLLFTVRVLVSTDAVRARSYILLWRNSNYICAFIKMIKNIIDNTFNNKLYVENKTK